MQVILSGTIKGTTSKESNFANKNFFNGDGHQYSEYFHFVTNY